jgi:putative ABC transport system permease protein
MSTLGLAWHSVRNRRATALLTIFTIALSVTLLLSVQMLRTAARTSFENTLSGTDLIVGARTGSLNLLLYSIFRIGDASANVSWKTYLKVTKHRDVAWTIPISLGDSHHGFRVLGTNEDYFRHYRFGAAQSLHFAAGGPFRDLYDAVLGAEVARSLHYRMGDEITLAHGTGAVSFALHRDKPFRVVGVLAPTGTPVDRAVHVSLRGITAIHLDWRTGMQAPEKFRIGAQAARARDLTPDSVTAFLVGMRNKVMTLTMQRAIDDYPDEALLAIVPGVALTQLWDLVGIADTALMIVAAFVVLAGLLGMMTSILTSLNERRREIAILRSVGARTHHVFGLLVAEAGVLATLGTFAGLALTYLLLFAGRPILQQRFGIAIAITLPSREDLEILGAIIAGALLIALVPATRAYRTALSDGLQVRT